MKEGKAWLILGFLAFSVTCSSSADAPFGGRISLITSRGQGTAASRSDVTTAVQLSPDGKLLLFSSAADNLIPDDTAEGSTDLFWTDLSSGITSQIAPNAQNLVYAPAGHMVAFDTVESLVAGDTNGVLDVYVKDLVSGKIELISISTEGGAGSAVSWNPSISRDGTIVAFQSSATNLAAGTRMSGVFVRDRREGVTKLVTAPFSGSEDLAPFGLQDDLEISGNGRFVTYSSNQNYLAANDADILYDVFIYDVETGTNELVSVDSGGVLPAAASFRSPLVGQDGRYVFFLSVTNILPRGEGLYMRDRVSQVTRLISSDVAEDFTITPDGAYVAFTATNRVYRYEVASGQTWLVSSLPNGTPDGLPGNNSSDSPSISDDGRLIAFSSTATNLKTLVGTGFRVYLRDLSQDTIYLAGPSDQEPAGDAVLPILSGDGSTLVFESPGSLAFPGENNGGTDLFIAHAPWLAIDRVPVPGLVSASANGLSELARPPFSPDGRHIAFSSLAQDLSLIDTNHDYDIYVHNARTGRNELISVNSSGTAAGNGASFDPALSADGRFVAFWSMASNLVEGIDTNNVEDIFVRDRELQKTFLVSAAYGTTNRAGSAPSTNPSISADGRFVAFESIATNLWKVGTPFQGRNVYVRDLSENKTILVSQSATREASANLSSASLISPNGRYVAFSSSSSDLIVGTYRPSIYLRDLQTSKTIGVTNGTGTAKLFSADSSTLVHLSQTSSSRLFYFDLNSETSQLIDTNVVSIDSVSSNGTLFAYTKTDPSTLQRNVWVFNRADGSHLLVNVNTNGLPSNGNSEQPFISPTGDFVLFKSTATDLLPGVLTPNSSQIFLRALATSQTFLVSRSRFGGPGNDQSYRPWLSPDGRSAAFYSLASDLVPLDRNGLADLFLFTLDAQDTDGDGLADDWEIAHFGNLGSSPAEDPDRDGMTNIEEFRADTDPARKDSALQVIGVEVLGNGQRKISWKSSAGFAYALEYKMNLNDQSWISLPGETQATGSTASKIDSDTTQARRFYRLRLVE